MSSWYRLHDLWIEARTGDPVLRRTVDETLRYKHANPVPPPSDPADAFHLHLIAEDEPASFPQDAELQGVTDRATEVWTDSTDTLLRHDSSFVRILPESGQAVAHIAPALRTNAIDERAPLISLLALTLFVLLRHRGYFVTAESQRPRYDWWRPAGRTLRMIMHCFTAGSAKWKHSPFDGLSASIPRRPNSSQHFAGSTGLLR